MRHVLVGSVGLDNNKEKGTSSSQRYKIIDDDSPPGSLQSEIVATVTAKARMPFKVIDVGSKFAAIAFFRRAAHQSAKEGDTDRAQGLRKRVDVMKALLKKQGIRFRGL